MSCGSAQVVALSSFKKLRRITGPYHLDPGNNLPRALNLLLFPGQEQHMERSAERAMNFKLRACAKFFKAKNDKLPSRNRNPITWHAVCSNLHPKLLPQKRLRENTTR